MSSYAAVAPQSSTARTLHIYVTEAKYEFLKTLRQPAYVIPTLTFPLLFYVMFGIVFGGRQDFRGVSVATYMLATYATFGVMGASLFGFAAGVAMERGYGWLQVKRASPMPPLAYLAAKTFMSMMFSAILVTSLFVVGEAFGGVHLSLVKFIQLATLMIAGTIPFCALGLAIGCYVAPNSAPAIVNILFLPMAFCSGLWLPLPLLPKLLQGIAPFFPPYHLAQLALRQVGFGGSGNAWVHAATLAAFTAAFLLLAQRGFRRDDVSINA